MHTWPDDTDERLLGVLSAAGFGPLPSQSWKEGGTLYTVGWEAARWWRHSRPGALSMSPVFGDKGVSAGEERGPLLSPLMTLNDANPD